MVPRKMHNKVTSLIYVFIICQDIITVPETAPLVESTSHTVWRMYGIVECVNQTTERCVSFIIW